MKGCDFLTFPDVTTKVVHCVYYRNNESWNHPVNIYPYNTLYLVLDGDGEILVDGKIIRLLPEHAYLIPPNTQFSCKCIHYIEKIYIDLHAELLPGLDIFGAQNDIAFVPLVREEILDVVRRSNSRNTLGDNPSFTVLEPASFCDKLWYDAFLLRILSDLLPDNWTSPDIQFMRYRAILDDIDANLSAALRMSDIAARHGWHPATLSRAFQKDFGCSIKTYSENLLSARLRQELVTTDKTIKELAVQYQFCDAYYLSAFFKRREGISPSEYRKVNMRVDLYHETN
ncbi:MAG: hypothetical protein RHS_1648 [Robinsoniella sp. RHS]|nr:MAG: hypothetical protein RHS_1648 [Robinsoniella sp. RHS]